MGFHNSSGSIDAAGETVQTLTRGLNVMIKLYTTSRDLADNPAVQKWMEKVEKILNKRFINISCLDPILPGKHFLTQGSSARQNASVHSEEAGGSNPSPATPQEAAALFNGW